MSPVLILASFQPGHQNSDYRLNQNNGKKYKDVTITYDVVGIAITCKDTCFREEKKLECDDSDNGRMLMLLSISLSRFYG